jgi:competence protein ComEA
MVRTLLSSLVVASLAMAYPVADQQKASPSSPSGPSGPSGSSRSSSAKPPVTSPININTATASELDALPGIGAKTAARIVEYRQKNGPFKKVEELMNVRGVGEKNFLKLKSQITVAPAKAEHAVQ